MLYPLTFHPLLKDRVWGGRKLAELFGRTLPPGSVIGESWEISDRQDDVSIVSNGSLAGRDLHWLVENCRDSLLGAAAAPGGRFPLLIKILDARQALSLQVHPPAELAPSLHGEPKTEMWHIVDADPGAELFVGLRSGVTRLEFEARLQDGTVDRCFHRIPVKAGDTMFLPSGRVHAIGAGLVIFEVQQNSDTTYRVFDWNRLGLDGNPRPLHLRESLVSIDFDDIEPDLVRARETTQGFLTLSTLVAHPLFQVNRLQFTDAGEAELGGGQCSVLGVVRGSVEVHAPEGTVSLRGGEFCLIPACLGSAKLRANEKATLLRAIPGPAGCNL